jgi:two-component system, sensor histidine kinase FlrB
MGRESSMVNDFLALDEFSVQGGEGAQQNLELLDHAAAYLAHELRNPLSAALLFVSLLRDEAKSKDKVLHLVSALERTLTDMNEVIGGVLQFSRQKIMPENIVNIVSIIKELKVEFDTRLNEGELVLDCDGSPFVVGDESGLRQVMRNLLLNAFQAMHSHGTIKVILFESKPGRLRCEVCDNGPGVPLAKQQHIFEPFFTTKNEGTGLGLAVVAQILQHHGATYGVFNNFDNSGATFWFDIDRYGASI